MSVRQIGASAKCARGEDQKQKHRSDTSDGYISGAGIGRHSRIEGRSKDHLLTLPEPSEERGIGDILQGTMSDPDSNPVEEVRSVRRRI